MKKLFKVFIKYIPIVQMIIFFLNNILLYFDIIEQNFIVNYLFGNSFAFSLLLIIISYTFNYCNWYRLIVCGNILNLMLGFTDALFDYFIEDFKMLLMSSSVTLLFIILAILSKFNCLGARR